MFPIPRSRDDSPVAVRHVESGQAALFSALLIPVVLLAALFVFNTGQLSAIKLKTQNAADAAAFSAMQMEARELNFISYTNRAMVANQVAIGQTISLVSWAHYVKSLGLNIQRAGTIASFIPYVGQAIMMITNGIAKAATLLDQSVSNAAKVALPALDIADAALSGAQEIYHLSNGAFDPGTDNSKAGGAMTAVAEQVIKIHDPDARLNAILLASNLGQYFKNRSDLIQRWGGDKNRAQARMAYMINASRDGFTAARNDLPTPLRFFSSPNLWSFGWEFRRAGGTQLAPNRDGRYVWSGMDTLSFHYWQRKAAFFGGKKWSEIPLGYGASQTGNGNNFSYPSNYTETRAQPQMHFPADDRNALLPAYQNSWNANSGASRIAASLHPEDQNGMGSTALKRPGGDSSRATAGGITRYWDFNRRNQKLVDANGDPSDIMPFYTVVVEHARESVRDAANALRIHQMASRQDINLVLPQKALEGQVRAVAKAQAYFRRPAAIWQRNDRFYERGNLFSPFWEARLVDLDAADRMQYAAMLGLH